MKIGYCVEGSTDKAAITGFRDRWCQQAELVEGRFRGTFRRREIPHACLELREKGADIIILMRDANGEGWRDVADDDYKKCGDVNVHLVAVGVCGRNVECWLVAEPNYAAAKTGIPAAEFLVNDPKNVFERGMKITPLERRQKEIAEYVRDGPLKAWLANNKSFEHFYDQLWQKSKQLGCLLENLRESQK
jgi:hypothetical protein